MATFRLGPDSRFHVGATVFCYLGIGQLPALLASSATVASDSTTTFTGLQDGTRYLAGLSVVGPFVAFSTPAATDDTGGGDGGGGATVDTVQYDADAGWGPRPHDERRMVTWNGGDVSTPPAVGGETGALDGVDWWVPASGEGA